MDMDYLSGTVMTSDGLIEGYVCLEDGIITEISEGKSPEKPLAEGFVIPPMVNGHTHCADGGLDIPEGIGLEELVGPGGIKHRYLTETSPETLAKNIKKYSDLSYSNGIGTFIDFREGGVNGSKMLRETVPGSFILGRPTAKEFDPREIDEILKYADGIALSSIADIPRSYSEAVADHTHRRGRMFAIHASEKRREDIDAIMSLSPSFVVHMASSERSDLLRCADEGVPIVVCPRSNRFFGLKPPVAMMEESNNLTILGTDNAMICSPDLRAEAKEYLSLLLAQKGIGQGLLDTMVSNGRKLLYDVKGIGLQPGNKADVTVLPSNDGTIKGMLENNKGIIRINMTKRE